MCPPDRRRSRDGLTVTLRSLMECDRGKCETEIVTEDGEFTSDLIDRSHESGWITVKRGDKLSNICPDCAADILS